MVFDVDGTLVDSERHGHRVAFNRAFVEFSLPDHWDEVTYGRLLRTTGGQRRIDGWLAARGVSEDERRRLVPALHARKTEIIRELIRDGAIQARPGATRLVAELAEAGIRLAVATTGSRGWVEQVLATALPDTRFEVVVGGEDVANRKPDPEAFLGALKGLRLGPGEAVAIEDSAEGLAAAKAAGLTTVVIVNAYTADHDVAPGDLVLDDFGTVEVPAHVVADPHHTGCAGVLDLAILRTVHGAVWST